MGIIKEITSAAIPYAILAGVGYIAYLKIKDSNIIPNLVDDGKKAWDESGIPDAVEEYKDSSWYESSPLKAFSEGDVGKGLWRMTPVGYVSTLFGITK